MKISNVALLFVAFTAILNLSSCKKDDIIAEKGAFSNGLFIINEGPYMNGTGSISFYKPDSNLLKQNIFELINGRPLGNIVQGMTFFNGKGYIVVNNSGKVEVVDAFSFKSEATITNLHNPACFIGVDAQKAYVSDWIGHIAVVDLNSNVVTKTIPAGTGPDVMLKSGGYVYVANSGGYSIDSTVTVIDFMTDKVVKTIFVGDAPSGMVADGNGKIWVICKGKGFSGWPNAGDTHGKLVRIDPGTLSIDYTYNFASTGDHPEKLVINNQKSILYFLFNNGIYRFNIATLAKAPEKMVSRGFYGLNIERSTGYLYATDPKDYINAGILLRLKSEDGTVVDSIQAGIIPRSVTFFD